MPRRAEFQRNRHHRRQHDEEYKRRPERQEDAKEKALHFLIFISSSSFSGLQRGVGQHIPNAPNRLDVVAALIRVAQFSPHLAHMHVDAPVKRHKLAPQHGIHQPLARHHSPRLAQQYLQQIKFH